MPKAQYRANYKSVDVRAVHLVEIPEGAVGVTVSPAPDGGPTLVVAWLEPLEPAPSQEETE